MSYYPPQNRPAVAPQYADSPLIAIPQMGELSGSGCLGPFFGKGPQVDAWADVIEGMSAKAPEILQSFDLELQTKQIPVMNVRTESLTAPGVGAEKRIYLMVRRMPALMAVYIAGLGADLYVSWRLFVKTPFSLFRILAWLATSCFFALCNPLTTCGALFATLPTGFGTNRNPSALDSITALVYWAGGLIVGTIFNAFVLAVIAAVIGYRLTGDLTYLWRVPLNEFHEDDVAALSLNRRPNISLASSAE